MNTAESKTNNKNNNKTRIAPGAIIIVCTGLFLVLLAANAESLLRGIRAVGFRDPPGTATEEGVVGIDAGAGADFGPNGYFLWEETVTASPDGAASFEEEEEDSAEEEPTEEGTTEAVSSPDDETEEEQQQQEEEEEQKKKKEEDEYYHQYLRRSGRGRAGRAGDRHDRINDLVKSAEQGGGLLPLESESERKRGLKHYKSYRYPYGYTYSYRRYPRYSSSYRRSYGYYYGNYYGYYSYYGHTTYRYTYGNYRYAYNPYAYSGYGYAYTPVRTSVIYV